MNKKYLISLILLILIVPLIGIFVDSRLNYIEIDFDLFAKWFIFSTGGMRLLFAGVVQTINPSFTAHHIFKLGNKDSFPIIRELGFANISAGLLGVISLFLPQWRIICSFASGLYYLMAGIQHFVKKPASINEKLALWTDLFIATIFIMFFIKNI